MVTTGKGNATIAHQLMISLKTVRNHVSNIFTKLQVSDRSTAIVARTTGLAATDKLPTRRSERGILAGHVRPTRSSRLALNRAARTTASNAPG